MKNKFLIIIFIMAMFLTGCDGNKNNYDNNNGNANTNDTINSSNSTLTCITDDTTDYADSATFYFENDVVVDVVIYEAGVAFENESLSDLGVEGYSRDQVKEALEQNNYICH